MDWGQPISYEEKSVFIFGKGPCFHETLQQEDCLGDIRICINETVLHVPDPTYVISLNQSTWPALIPAFQKTNVKALVEKNLYDYVVSLGIPKDRIIPFTLCVREEYLFRWSREELARSKYLYGNMGSAVPAVHWAWYLGAGKISFVGFDGGCSYAPEFSDMQPSHYNDQIWERVLHTCEQLGIEPFLYGSGEAVEGEHTEGAI